MTVIQNIVKDATGAPVVNASVTIRLVGAPAFDSTTSSETVQPGPVTTDANGMWSKDLTPVSHYNVAGCYYRVSEPGGSIRSFTVPDSGGPYWLNNVLTVAPTAPEASLGVVRYDADQTTVLTSAQQAQARANIGAGTGGGGGAVASVNGQTGAVVLGAADVGADAAGAAATAQAAAIAASQPLDSDLTAIAALTTTVYGRSLLTAADAAALRTAAVLGTAATQNTTAFDAAGAASAAQSAAISAAATDATTKANAAQAAAIAASQPLDSDLTAIAALTTTSFGRSFLALADAAAARALLALGGAATLNVGTTTGTVAAGDDSRITGAVPKSTVTAKGSLIAGTGAGAVADHPAGSNGQTLYADTTQSDGMAWGPVGLRVPSGLYAFLTNPANGQVTLTKNRENIVGFVLCRQTISQLAFQLQGTAPDAGAVVRVGIRADANGAPGSPVVDSPITVTASAWNAVTVNYAHPGGILWVSLTSQNWTTSGPSLETGTATGAVTPTGSALSTLGWASGHGPISGYQDGVTGALPGTFVNVASTNQILVSIAAKGA